MKKLFFIFEILIDYNPAIVVMRRRWSWLNDKLYLFHPYTTKTKTITKTKFSATIQSVSDSDNGAVVTSWIETIYANIRSYDLTLKTIISTEISILEDFTSPFSTYPPRGSILGHWGDFWISTWGLKYGKKKPLFDHFEKKAFFSNISAHGWKFENPLDGPKLIH